MEAIPLLVRRGILVFPQTPRETASSPHNPPPSRDANVRQNEERLVTQTRGRETKP